ncbi:FeoA family protein [Peptostreptococcus equinus]|uniref:FeoA family protein n=1 Tax=Peptostreptococcus equinus TaxID=3003601 RepID=A0ABY7JNA8_9FIRM|nr:FeoA family protein [Peptostreptococcus sp. CBA3647]WAW14659.1 FeoA family protein [Peptostreptococcus sp. CBA3647]
MNLSIAPIGVAMQIVKIRIKDDQKKQLANMGFVDGTPVTVISENMGNIIVNVRDSRVGIGKDLAKKINVSPLN